MSNKIKKLREKMMNMINNTDHKSRRAGSLDGTMDN